MGVRSITILIRCVGRHSRFLILAGGGLAGLLILGFGIRSDGRALHIILGVGVAEGRFILGVDVHVDARPLILDVGVCCVDVYTRHAILCLGVTRWLHVVCVGVGVDARLRTIVETFSVHASPLSLVVHAGLLILGVDMLVVVVVVVVVVHARFLLSVVDELVQRDDLLQSFAKWRSCSGGPEPDHVTGKVQGRQVHDKSDSNIASIVKLRCNFVRSTLE